MSFTGVIIGTLVQLGLAGFLFMATIFTGAGIGNVNQLSDAQMSVLTLSIYVLPGSCVVSGIIVWWAYRNQSGAIAYWWYALPLLLAAAYFVYAMILNQSQ